MAIHNVLFQHSTKNTLQMCGLQKLYVARHHLRRLATAYLVNLCNAGSTILLTSQIQYIFIDFGELSHLQ